MPNPLGPIHSPSQPIRRASHTVSTGNRCARCAFLPNTLRSARWRYWKAYGILPPGARCSLGNRTRWVVWLPIHPAGKRNPFCAPYTLAISQRWSVPPHTSAYRCNRSRVIILNRANSGASLANFCRASLTLSTYAPPSAVVQQFFGFPP